jgi:diaminopimelate epimerase
MNSDGSEAEMCGNGIRCLAKHVYDLGHKKQQQMTIETLAGIMNIRLDIAGDEAVAATVEMGAPRLERRDIPVKGEGRFIDQPIEVEGKVLHGTAVSMGNPHLMIFDELSDQEVERLGPLVHAHPLFPRRTNVEFVKSVNGILDVRVYERGAGWTMACGTGACATAVAAGLLGKVPFGKEVQVRLPGGSLWIKVSQDLSMVTMRGPAALVFEGRM